MEACVRLTFFGDTMALQLKSTKVLDYIKSLGVSKLTLEFYGYYDDGELNGLERVHVMMGKTLLKHSSLNEGSEILLQLAQKTVNDVKLFDRITKMNLGCDEWDSYHATLTINLEAEKVLLESTVYFTTEADPISYGDEYILPTELRKLAIPFTITYSGSGDSGGIDGIDYNKEPHPQWRKWVDDHSDDMVPQDANFNNEGSRGEVHGTIDDDGLVITECDHIENIEGSEDLDIVIKYDDVNHTFHKLMEEED